MASYPEYKGIVDFAQAIDDTYVRKDAPSVPVGGAKGEVLRKKSSTDGDAEWADPMYHFETLAQMQTALSQGQIPDGANIVVEEEQPGGNTGDTTLDTTSENWVQNKVVAIAISNLNSDLSSVASPQKGTFNLSSIATKPSYGACYMIVPFAFANKITSLTVNSASYGASDGSAVSMSVARVASNNNSALIFYTGTEAAAGCICTINVTIT